MSGFFTRLGDRLFGGASDAAPAEGAAAQSGRIPAGGQDSAVSAAEEAFPDAGPGQETDRVVYQLVAVLLGYPDSKLVEMLPALAEIAEESAVPGLPEAVEGVRGWLAGAPLEDRQGEYVQEFDLSRRHSLDLSYWTDGDTRRRGHALGLFKQAYRDSGWLTDLRGELPDHLPIVLEFAAQVDLRRGRAVLQAYRPSLELLRLALKDTDTPHERLVELVCRTLPGVSPDTREEIMAMAGAGPPQESVGLAAGDPRLLPLADTTSTGARR